MTITAATTLSATTIWGIIVAAGAGTYLIRLSFIGAWGRFERVPDGVTRALALVPAAVMAALVLPALFYPEGTFDVWNDRLIGGIVAAVVAVRFRNVLATLTAGMATVWVLQLVS